MKSKNVIDTHREKIALKTLKMTPAMSGVMGGMSKEEAIEFLKSIGYSDSEIKKLSESSLGNVKLKSLIPELSIDTMNSAITKKEENQTGNPIHGMNKKKAINYIYKTFDIHNKLKGIFTDDWWKPINNIINDLHNNNIPLQIEDTKYSKNDEGEPISKTWECIIPFMNQNNRQDKIYCRIVASGAGTVKDPLSKYDVVFYLS